MMNELPHRTLTSSVDDLHVLDLFATERAPAIAAHDRFGATFAEAEMAARAQHHAALGVHAEDALARRGARRRRRLGRRALRLGRRQL